MDDSINRLQINGASGSGKTSLMRALLARRNVRRLLIFDTEDEYEPQATIHCYSARELYDALSDITPDHEFSVRYVPPEAPADREPDEVLEQIGKEAGHLCQWAMSLGDCVVAIDEAHESAHRKYLDARTLRCVKKGRKRGVFAWVSSQRPADIDISVRSELLSVEAWYLLLVENADLDVLHQRRGREFAQRVASLPPLSAFRLTPHSQEPEEWKISFRGERLPPILTRVS
jgi:hypothetical protein